MIVIIVNEAQETIVVDDDHPTGEVCCLSQFIWYPLKMLYDGYLYFTGHEEVAVNRNPKRNPNLTNGNLVPN